MKELAYNKILVLTYERSYFRLVLSHFHIAKEYLKFKCYEQTISHIEQAMNKNVKAASNRSKIFLIKTTNYSIPIFKLTLQFVFIILKNLNRRFHQ